MALLRLTSPHAFGSMSTQRVMQNVLLATVPGIIVLTHFFGFGTLVNIAWGSVVALACERPEEGGVPLSQWSAADLAREAVRRGIVTSISPRSVGRFLRIRPPAASRPPLAHAQARS